MAKKIMVNASPFHIISSRVLLTCTICSLKFLFCDSPKLHYNDADGVTFSKIQYKVNSVILSCVITLTEMKLKFGMQVINYVKIIIMS